jgi:hypothetical protein
MLVTFMDDVAQGGMSGPGWVALGASDVLLYPICLRQTGTDRCNADGWDSTTNLCASAYLPSTSSPIAEDNWGLEIGADVASPNAPLGRSYGSISVIFTGKPSSNLRIVLHRSGDPATTTYCQDQVQSGSSYHLTGFNTLCQDGSGAQFAVSDAALIDQIGLQVTASTSAIAVSNLCLGSIMLTQ